MPFVRLMGETVSAERIDPAQVEEVQPVAGLKPRDAFQYRLEQFFAQYSVTVRAFRTMWPQIEKVLKPLNIDVSEVYVFIERLIRSGQISESTRGRISAVVASADDYHFRDIEHSIPSLIESLDDATLLIIARHRADLLKIVSTFRDEVNANRPHMPGSRWLSKIEPTFRKIFAREMYDRLKTILPGELLTELLEEGELELVDDETTE